MVALDVALAAVAIRPFRAGRLAESLREGPFGLRAYTAGDPDNQAYTDTRAATKHGAVCNATA